MTDLLIPPKRRRGSQPGNLNALKHGFYTSRFKPKDLTGVDATDNNSLLDEIRILRLYTRRLIELDAQPDDLTQVANILKLLCLSALTINRLVKTSQFLQANSKKFLFRASSSD